MYSSIQTLVSTQIRAPRLIVLVAANLINHQEFAAEVFRLAVERNLSVFYLVMIQRETDFVKVSREMTTMQAVTAANQLSVEVKIIPVQGWVDSLIAICQPSDVILCQAEMLVEEIGIHPLPLEAYLMQHSLSNSVITMDGIFQPEHARSDSWQREVIGLFGFIGILFLFSWLQIAIEAALSEGLSKLYVSLTFLIEMVVVLAWHKLMFTRRSN